ncbi:MAG: hypothetical protein ACM3VZ_05915 [Acidobacteriota bacterium]
MLMLGLGAIGILAHKQRTTSSST